MRYWEDIKAGEVIELGRRAVTKEAILTFACLIAQVCADRLIADADTEVAEHDIVRSDVDAVVLEGDAVAGSALRVEGEEGIADAEACRERNRAGHAEDDDARAFGFDGGAETAGAGIVQVVDV